MGFRDKVSDAKDTAAESISDAKDSVSKQSEDAKEKISDAKTTAADAASGAKDTVSEKTETAKGKLSESVTKHTVETPDIDIGRSKEKAASAFASMSFSEFSSPDFSSRHSVRHYGGKATGVAKEIDYKQSYLFGKAGLKYGKKYGDYAPVGGGFLPYIGFVAGIGVGVMDSMDVLSADDITELSSSVTDAADQVIRTEEQSLSKKLATGGAEFADSHYGNPNEDGINDILEMDYDDFAGI